MARTISVVQGDADSALPTYEYIYSSNKTGANFATEMATGDWNGTDVANFLVTVNSSIELTVGSQTGSFPAGSTLTLTNKGTIRGTNGNGDDGLALGFDIVINNGSGNIWGGGGAGGAGGTSGNCGQRCVPDGEGGQICTPAPPQPGTPGADGDYGDAGSPGTPGGCGGTPGSPGGASGYAIRLNGNTVTFSAGGTPPNIDGTIG